MFQYRYRAIVSSPGKRLQIHHARWLVFAIWIASFAIAIAPITFLGEYKQNAKSTNCRPMGQGYVLLLSVVCFLLPFITMTFCYSNVYLKVRKQRIQLQAWMSTNINMTTELKTAKIVFTVLSVFLVCWLPFVMIYILSNSGKADDISPAVFLLTGCLTAAHSVCNPIIYFTMNRAFREDLKSWLRKLYNKQDVVTHAATVRYSRNSAKEGNMRKEGTSQEP